MYCRSCGEEIPDSSSYCTQCGDAVDESPDKESGSTILGLIVALVALFFFYIGIQRVWWSLSLGLREYLTFGLIYIIIGWVATCGATYGLVSRRTWAKVVDGTSAVSAVMWLFAAYYWITGYYIERSPVDTFNALNFGLAGIILLAVGLTASWALTRRGLLGDSQAESA